MSNQTYFRCKLDVIFRNGRYGLFPVGIIYTPFGTYACRDKWLETIDEGSYNGDFDIESIGLSGYMTRGPVREQRSFIKAVIRAYHFDSMNDEVQPSELDSLDDPINDDDAEIEAAIFQQSEPTPIPQWIEAKDNEVPEMVLFIRGQLQSTGYDAEWQDGQPLTIPAELGRIEQRKIRDYLLNNGYKITDPINRLWEVQEVANV